MSALAPGLPNLKKPRRRSVLLLIFLSVIFGVLSTVTHATGASVLNQEAVSARINKYRTTTATLKIVGPGGKPLAHKTIVVAMQRHKFLFGANLYNWGNLKDKNLENNYRRRFVEVFNFATLPFYWGSYEPRQGKTEESALRAMAKWCRKKGIVTKGHPLVWHEVPAPWQASLKTDAMRRVQLLRVEREVKTFTGLIDMWDVVNEAVVMPWSSAPVGRLSTQMGVNQLLKAAFIRARQTNPKAVLILNDYNQGTQFEKLIRKSLNTQTPIDVIGIQSHMHNGYPGAKHLWQVSQRFARFTKPLHWTEATIVSGRLKTWEDMKPVKGWHSTAEGEIRQAKQAINFYRLLFSHPAVEAITWWDLSDKDAWMGAPAGLIRHDMTPKSAYQALKKLIKKEWWTGPLTLKTDLAGRIRFHGFLGHYVLRVAGLSTQFILDTPGKTSTVIKLGPNRLTK
jgi:endo-1,4-beta-xylanase